MTQNKKNAQLGMNHSTARNVLFRNLLYEYVHSNGHATCFKCGTMIECPDEMSIEHKTPWLDSEDPLGLFFDLDNIAFSHRLCNKPTLEKQSCGVTGNTLDSDSGALGSTPSTTTKICGSVVYPVARRCEVPEVSVQLGVGPPKL